LVERNPGTTTGRRWFDVYETCGRRLELAHLRG
jgi:hypothetical protein